MPTIDEFLDSYTPPAQAGQALNIANGYAKPEDAALALKTARQSGLPAETVDLDPAGFAQQQRQRENARILEANQSLSAFIGDNPVEGKAIHDDLDKLDFFTKQLTAIKSGWQRGKLEEIRGNIGFTAAMGLGGEERAEEISQEVATLPEFKAGAAHWTQAIAGMISGSLVDLSIGGGAGLVGAAGGAAVGPVGAAVGFTGGALLGMGAAMGTSAHGRTFLELSKARDENGQPLSKASIQIASGLVGVTVGAIGMLGLKSAASQEVASGIIREATVEAMKNPGFREALTKGTVELAKGGTTGAAMMGSITAIQEGVMDAAKGLSDGDWKTLANDPKRRQEVVSAINQAMVEGAVLVGGLHTPGVAANFVRDAAAIRQSKADATALDTALQAAKDTQTAARSPEALAALIRHEVGDQVIGVPVEAIDKVLAAKPDALNFVPELARQIAEARAAGTDVKLPLAEFLANAGDDVKTALRDEVRMREDGLTPREAKKLEESPPDYAAVAYHGSPHIFDAFDITKIGSGEGAQSYGHGLYFAEAPGVAKSYRDNLANRFSNLDQVDLGFIQRMEEQGYTREQIIKGLEDRGSTYGEATYNAYQRLKAEPPGALYQVRLKLDPERTILYDRPLSEQPGGVLEGLAKASVKELGGDWETQARLLKEINTPAGEWLDAAGGRGKGDHGLIWNSDAEASKALRESGIQGIKYLDQDSRATAKSSDKARIQKLIDQAEQIVRDAEKDDAAGLITYKEDARAYDREGIKSLREELAEIERQLSAPKTHNYVVLDDKLIEITHRNGEAVVKQQVVEAAAREQRANWLDPLLRPEGDKPPLGMTEAQYAAYSRKLEQLAAATERKAEALATREVAKRQSPEWKRNLAEITDEVRNDLRYEPRILVDSYLRDGILGNQTVGASDRLRLDRAAVEAILGDKEQLPKGTTVAKGGIHPDELASMLGYNSGQKMLMDLMELHRTRQVLGETPAKHFERLVDEEAARRMEQRYGRLDENIAREAQEMVVQQAQTEVLGAELEALARGGDFPLDRQSLEAATHELFADMSLERASDYKGFMRTIARLGRGAEMALLKGDVEAAFLAKQRQWQAHIMAQGAKQLEKDLSRFERLVKRFREPVLASVDQAYTDQIQGIMASFGMPSKRNPAELQSALRTPLVEFVDRKRQDGRELPVAAFLMDGSAPPFAELTTQQFHALNDSLTTLAHNGKEERLITREGEKVELQGMIAEAMGRFNQEPLKVQPFDPNAWDKTKAFFRSFDVALVKAEQMFQWLDKNDPTGVFTGVFQRFAKAKYAEHDMLTEIAGKVKELKGDAAFQKKLRNRLDNDRLFDWNTGELAQFTGRDLIAIMLHMGTESNLNKLTAKFEWGGMQRGWDRADVEAFVNRHATKEHWDLVQGIWDLNNNYFWPKIEEHSRRLAGIAPDKLEPRKITTPFGEYEGGYSPVDRDPRWPHGGGDVADGLFRETQFRNAIPKKDYTLTRTEAAYPVWINFESVFNGMRETVHDLAYRESLMDGVKFLRAPKIREGIQQTLGKEYADSIQPWLEHMAKGKLMDDATLSGIQSLSRWARQRLVMVELVGRASTIVKHSMAALLDSVGEVGVKDFATAAMDVYGNVPNIPSTLRPILERSGELRSRWHAWDRDLKEMANRNLTGELSIRERAALFMSYPLAVLDQMSAVPVFVAAERKFLEQGHPPEQAALMADTVVRNAHGAAGAPDLPPLLRASEGYKLLTVAYTFFNHNYNRVRNIGRETVEGGRDFGKGNVAEAFGHWTKAASLTFWYVILMGMYERWVTHGGPDEDKEESVGAWAAKGVTHQLAGNLPAVRDVAMPILGYLDDKKLTPGGPFSSVAKAVYDVVNTTGKYAKTDELSGSWWAHYARGAGYAAGLPGSGQVAVTGQFLWDLESGRQYADDIPSMLRGLSMGKSHPHERLGR